MRILLIVFLASVAAQTVSAEPGWWGDMVTSVKNSITKAVDKVQDLYKKALKDYPFLEEALKELEKQLAKSGGVLGSSLGKAKEFINSLEHQVQDLLKLIDEKLEAVSIEIAKVLLKEASGLKKWANSTLEGIDNPKKRESAEKIILKFLDQSMEQMNKCAKEVTKPIHELYIFANSTAMEATAIAKKVVSVLELCTKESEVKDCLKRLPKVLAEGKDLIYEKILPIKSKLKDVSTSAGLSLSSCVAANKVSIEIQKAAIVLRLKFLS